MDIESLIANLNPNDPEQIKTLQRALQVQGFDLPVDGKMGGKTANAIRQVRDAIVVQKEQALKARQLEQQAAERGWQNQAIQAAKYSAIPLGLYAGHRMARGVERRQLATEAAQRAGTLPDAPRGWSSPRRFSGRFAPYALRGGLLTAEGLALREGLAPQLENETARETARIAGSGLIGAGIGLTGEGVVKSFTPQVSGGPMPGGPGPIVPTGGLPETPPPGPPPGEPSGGPRPGAPQPRPFSERLIRAARAAGATGKLTKNTAATFLNGADFQAMAPDIRASVGRELGEAPGRNFAQRVGEAVKKMSSTRGASGFFWPLVAGGIAGQAAYSDAEARGRTPGEARANALAAAGAGGAATAGIGYGLSKVGPAVSRALAPVTTAMGRMAGPAMAMEFVPEVERRVAAGLPPDHPLQRYFQQGRPQPSNALGQAAAQPDEFQQAMDDFLAMAREYQAEMEGGGEELAPEAPPSRFMARNALGAAGMR